jgi:hypothetical protein
MKKLSLVGIVVVSLFLVTGSALAASTTAPLTINAAVSSTAKLSLGVATIAFPDADPDDFPSISATQNPVSVTAKAKTTAAGGVTLTVQTSDDLKSGTDVIAITNVTWTAAGAGFVAGTMNKTTAQSAGSWTGSGNRSGSFSYSLANSWGYATGAYTTSATYTLSSP